MVIVFGIARDAFIDCIMRIDILTAKTRRQRTKRFAKIGELSTHSENATKNLRRIELNHRPPAKITLRR